MPRPKLVSDERLTAVARRVFLEAGVNAPVSLVAKALGVTPAALFHRTGSREQLFVMAMTARSSRQFKLLKVIREGPRPDTPVVDQLVEILTRLSAHLSFQTPNLLLMHAAGVIRPSRRRSSLSEQTHRYLAGWLTRAQRLDSLKFRNPSMVAHALVGTIEARHLYGYLSGRPVSVAGERRFVRGLVDELLSAHDSTAKQA